MDLLSVIYDVVREGVMVLCIVGRLVTYSMRWIWPKWLCWRGFLILEW